MKHVQLIKLEKYDNPAKFEKVGDGVYKALYDYENELVQKGQYVTAFSFTLEQDLNEGRQYPLEDILDKYLAHVSEYIQYEKDNPIMKLELCTQLWLDKMEELIKINNKRVYNREVIKDGKTYIELVIE